MDRRLEGRDITWKEIRPLLDSKVEPDVQIVASDVASAIDGRVLALDLAPDYEERSSRG